MIAQGLTPESLVGIFAQTRRGKLWDFLRLAKDLEKHDAHYRSVLGIRKLAVLRRKPVVLPADEDDGPSVVIADEFSDQVVDTPEWFELTLHLLDALGKGFAVAELVWDFSEGQAHPEFVRRNPLDFTLHPVTLDRIVRIVPTAPLGFEELEPGKYICHTASLIQGNPIDGALGYTASILYLYSNLALQDLGGFLEKFGTPFLFGEYLREDQKDALFEGLEQMARAGHGVGPKGTNVHAIDGARIGGSENLHENAIEMINRLKSKLVLGQTMTTDDGSSRSQSEVHERVEEGVNDFDVISVSTSQTIQIFDVWRRLNFGDTASTGRLDRPGDDETDLLTLAKLAGELADRGVRVPARRILDAAGFPEPAEEDEVLQPRSTGEGDIPGMPGRLERALAPDPEGGRSELGD